MATTLRLNTESPWFGRVQPDGCVVVNHKHRSCFTVHGLWKPNQRADRLCFTVAAYFPDGWPLKEALYAAAQQFVAPVNGQIDHGPCDGAPHAFGVIIQICHPQWNPRQQFGWLGQCLYNALLTAVELANQPASAPYYNEL